MSKRKIARRDNNVYQLTEALMANGKAAEEGPKRKHWTLHDLKQIKPMTNNQSNMFREYDDGKHVIGYGSAGTGKTFLSIYLALCDLLDPTTQYERIIIVRSAVPTRDMGFMPGSLEEKTALFELPYQDIFAELLGKGSSYQDMKDAGKVEFCTTSYVRGLTWDNAIIIMDEAQSATFHEINSVITRVGKNTRLLVAGDLAQNDLTKKGEISGMAKMIHVGMKMSKQFGVVAFTQDDIVRSAFVKAWIMACNAADM
jgi:phosphate starvation-inducible protein PhoH